jgi:hypothetical protein
VAHQGGLPQRGSAGSDRPEERLQTRPDLVGPEVDNF